jgi:hypothetical protein
MLEEQIMGPAYFVLAVLGCGDAETMCREVRVVDARYQSAAECMAAMDAKLGENTDLAFPVLMGRCRPGSPQMAEGKKDRAG